MRPPVTSLAICALLAGSSAASAQGRVHVVDASGLPGFDFLTIEGAQAAAAPGDVILIRAGGYGGPVGDGTNFVAEVDALVNCNNFVSSDLPESRPCLVQGLRFLSFGEAATLRDAAGPIWFERCEFLPIKPSFFPETGFSAFGCAAVVLSRCSGRYTPFNATALIAGSSRLHVHESQLRGDSSGGMPAVGLEAGAFLELFGSSVLGGDGQDGTSFSCHGEDGQDAIHVAEASRLVGLGSTLEGGAGGAPFGACNPGADGEDLVLEPGSTAAFLTGSARSLSLSSPVRENDQIVATFRGQPGDRVWLRFSRAPGPGIALPPLDGEFLLCGGSSGVSIGMLPASGVLTIVAHAPVLPASWESTILFCQALFRDAATQRFVVSSPAALVVLDGTL